MNSYAWTHNVSGLSTTKPVGQLLPNELGLYDLSWNVIQWCSDGSTGLNVQNGVWWTPSGAVTNYQGTGSAHSRVICGSSWSGNPPSAWVANRSYCNPYINGADGDGGGGGFGGAIGNSTGFRVVRP
ncbi:MAG: SUMF1/EgtB/PvdO family nonheme iron enzyme [Brevinematales bacterium]